jgi:hypothetical protein
MKKMAFAPPCLAFRARRIGSECETQAAAAAAAAAADLKGRMLKDLGVGASGQPGIPQPDKLDCGFESFYSADDVFIESRDPQGSEPGSSLLLPRGSSESA